MIEVLALGIGATPDLATFEALRQAVRESVPIAVDSRTWVYDRKVIDHTVMTQSAGYIRGYTIREMKQEKGRYVVRVLAKVDETDLRRDLVKPSQGAALDGALWAARLAEKQAREQLEQDRINQHARLRHQFTTDREFRRTFAWRVEGIDLLERQVTATAFLPDWLRNVSDHRALIQFVDAKGGLVTDQLGRLYGISDQPDGARFALRWSEQVPPDLLARVRRIEVVWN